METLKKVDQSRDVVYVQTGKELRDFIKGDSFIQKRTKEEYAAGKLMPEFLTIYSWVNRLVIDYKGNEHVIFDGTPRKLHEAGVVNSFFEYFKLDSLWVIYIDIGLEEAVRRLLLRKRMDDDEKDIRSRMAWFESEVIPTLGYFENNPNYKFLKIDGERTIEEIHADIVKKVGLA